MKVIFIKKECVLITIWDETGYNAKGVLEAMTMTDILKPDNVVNRMYIISVAFQIKKKGLDKRDSFIILR